MQKDRSSASPNGEQSTSVSIGIGGMHCASCVASVEKSLMAAEGVVSANVNLVAESAQIQFDSTVASLDTIAGAVSAVGYEPIIFEEEGGVTLEESHKTEQLTAHERLERKVAVSAVLSIVILVGSMQNLFPFVAQFPRQMVSYFLFVLTVPVLFWAGAPFFLGAIGTLRHGRADMNTLIALGTSSAFLYLSLIHM